jgi:hypothetical protein
MKKKYGTQNLSLTTIGVVTLMILVLFISENKSVAAQGENKKRGAQKGFKSEQEDIEKSIDRKHLEKYITF